ncbi:hypothetical protein [Roseibium sp. RKSG952]|uniref:hypothetical protein n=1 Tax=Roseibium sp. RKSG952 TaxID=2529384 RepID=UPI0012BB5236|nr:hypothetical protein [Roseibium sp. RKSG952]MTH95993.1 hypothetical protein [Roseibium sp. RKSG952]
MKKIIPAILTPLLLTAQIQHAHAQTIGSTLGQFVDDVGNPFMMLIFFCSAVGGLFLFIKGLFKLAEASQERGGGGYGSGVACILAAAILIALPDAAGMGMKSLLGDVRGGGTLGGGGLDYNDSMTDSGTFLDQLMNGTNRNVKAPENCLDASAPMTCVAENLAKNIVPMAVYVLFALTFLVGFLGFAATIFKIVQSNDRRETTGGHFVRLALCALLMNSPFLLTLINTTIGITDSPITAGGLISKSSLLEYSVSNESETLAQYAELVTHSFWILALFGAWAFIRGIVMMKSVSEQGSQGGSYAMAGVFIVGGVLMVNMKFSICLVVNTIGYDTAFPGFCT